MNLIRFDPVYLTLFRCNKRAIRSFTNLSKYVRCLYNKDYLNVTTDIEQIKTHYFLTYRHVNP